MMPDGFSIGGEKMREKQKHGSTNGPSFIRSFGLFDPSHLQYIRSVTSIPSILHHSIDPSKESSIRRFHTVPKMPSPNSSPSLKETVARYWKEQCDAHQVKVACDEDEEDDYEDSIHTTAVRISKDLQLVHLNHGVSNLSMAGQEELDSDNLHTILTDVWIQHYVPACFAEAYSTTSSTGSGENVATARSVLALICAVALKMDATTTSPTTTRTSTSTLIHPLLDFFQRASTALSEPVRSLACFGLECLVPVVDDVGDEGSSIIADVLIPRLTDKAITVRGAAISAAGQVLRVRDTSSDSTSSTTALLEALLWNVWHDPSVTNRVSALQALPRMTHGDDCELLDHVIARLGDVKKPVRLAAVQVLMSNSKATALSPAQRAEIITLGLGAGSWTNTNNGSGTGGASTSTSTSSTRCQATQEATMELICVHWIKAAKFNLLNLLAELNVLEHEDEAEQVVRVVMGVASDSTATILASLSPPEQRAVQSSIVDSLITLKEPSNAMNDGEETASAPPAWTSEQLLLARVAATTDTNYLSKVVPDMGVLGDVFSFYSQALVATLNSGGDANANNINPALFACLQLLPLATAAGMEEEGSRRRFSSLLQALLTSSPAMAPLPDDLLDAACKALLTLHGANASNTSNGNTRRDDYAFTTVLSEIIQHLTTDRQEEPTMPSPLTTLRILSILSIVLEEASPAICASAAMRDVLQTSVVSDIVRNAIGNVNQDPEDETASLVRQAGVSCLGKLGLFSDSSVVLQDYKPLLLQVAADVNEGWTMRSQAVMALSDWALVFPEILTPILVNDNTTTSLVDNVLRPLLESTHPSVAAIAAEATAKLLFANRLCDSALLAQLLVLFFNPNGAASDDSNSDNSVGSLSRLQQWLSLFFPAYALQSSACREALLGSIESAVLLALTVKSKTPKKGKTKSAPFPVIKMVEYVCQVVAVAQEQVDHMNNEHHDDDMDKATNEETNDPSSSSCHTALVVAVQVAQVLLTILVAEEGGSSSNTASLNVTQLRGLCKLLGSLQVVDEESVNRSTNTTNMLLKLQHLLEELGMILTDGAALKAVTPLMQELSELDLNVEVEEENAPRASIGSSNASTITEDLASHSGDTTLDESLTGDVLGGGKENATTTTNSKAAPPSTIRQRGLRSSNASSIATTPGF